MKIGGFEVGPYAVKEEGGKRFLIFDCRNCIYGTSLSDDRACRYHAIKTLQEADANRMVLAEVYERVYNEIQTDMLKEIAVLSQKFEIETVWSYAHLGNPELEGEKEFGERHNILVKVAHEELPYDPISAYILCIRAIKEEKDRLETISESARSDIYLKTLLYLKDSLEKTDLISNAKPILLKLKIVPDTSELYRSFFEAQVKPSFIGSRLMFETSETLELLDEYSVHDSSIQIFKHPNRASKLYFVNPPEYSLPPEKYFILTKAKEVVASYRPGKTSLSTISKSRKYFERVYQATIRDIAKNNNIQIGKEEIVDLAKMVARYTVGYGILEILLSDRRITDIYIDSPIGGKPIYLVHSDYGQCETNIIYTPDEAESLVSKLRAMSGRPFDEAHPVLDFDLQDLETRVAVIGPPLAPDGIAFAFRLHKMTPWTLPQFIDVNYLTPLAAGLLSFFVDSQSTMLVTGSRGSGKTSLMGSLILEIPMNSRILVQEDTLEIPVPYIRNIGFNMQRMKTRSAISVSQTASEVSPEEALRTALRLGDSAIIVGEVRSKEAKVLYEAMRIGAAGNIIMGTIHGDSAYSVWDRVVNDLEVPNTSFKATDVVVVARPIRFSGSLKRNKRVVQITEVKKHWTTDPGLEGGLLDLMEYTAKKDKIELLEDNLKESDIFSKVSRLSGLTMEQIWQNIKMNANSKSFLVEMKNKHKIPLLLEAENTVFANTKLMLIKEEHLEEHGSLDYAGALTEWKEWIKENMVKRIIERQKKAI